MATKPVTFKYTLINTQNQQITLQFTHAVPGDLDFVNRSLLFYNLINSRYLQHSEVIEQHLRTICVRCNAPATASQNNLNAVAYSTWKVVNLASANPEIQYFILTACGAGCQSEIALRFAQSSTLDDALHRATAIMVFPSVE